MHPHVFITVVISKRGLISTWMDNQRVDLFTLVIRIAIMTANGYTTAEN